MAQTSKKGILGIILAALVVVASLFVLNCALTHRGGGHDMHHHDMKHGNGPEKLDEHGDHSKGIVIEGAYARANGASAKAGAAFLVIENHSVHDDRLVSVASDVATKVELHTHTEDADGLMVMGPIEGGLIVPRHTRVSLKRGGDHVMLMGLKQSLNQGDVVTVVFTFEHAGDMPVEIPVDLTR
jgi:copper(I)-binding protein